MAGRIAFVFNGKAGAGAHASWLEANRAQVEVVAAGGPISVVHDGGEIRTAVERALALGCDAVVACGGDGTLNAVASLLVARPVAFGILPFGTLNHFAKDLGIPMDPLVALQCVEAGHVVAVDVGQVNDRFFLNNSSIGLYVDMVRDRERQQHRLGRGKWSAFVWACLRALRRYPFMTVALDVAGKRSLQRTPLVFIGNNVYQMEGLQIGRREELRAGVLSVYVTGRAGRWRLLTLGLRALVGRLRQTRDFQALVATDLGIETSKRQLSVSIDGEVCRLETPLRYRIQPAALRVIVPTADEKA